MHNNHTTHPRSLWARRFLVTIISLIMILATPGVLLAKGGPPEKVDVIITASSSARAAALARGRGGQVKKQLGLINAVSVSLPLKAVQALLKHKDVVAIYPDADLQLSFDVSDLPELYTVADSFTAIAYNGNDGSASWSGDWIENDPVGAGPAWGNVNVVSGELRLDDRPNTEMQPSAAREVDLSGGITTAIFSFDFRTSPGVDAISDRIAIEVSDDGGANYTVLEIIDYIDGAASESRSYDITAYISADTRIRFRVAERYGGYYEYFAVDNVRISYAYPKADQASAIGVDQLHAKGITGNGVTVAVLDSGYWSTPGINYDTQGNNRILAYYDVLANTALSLNVLNLNMDPNGHGTHLASIIASSDINADAQYNGIAPDADLVIVRAFGADGGGKYSDVIAGIEWIVKNKDIYNIRVLNLSFAAPPQSFYWDDPLNQAVMKAWQAGIVVVAAAGNSGPEAMTIGVPGNVPYVITAGAFSDNQTPLDKNDDFITAFSSAGPTVEGFVKPEIVAPGSKLLGLMPNDSFLATNYPTWKVTGNYYTMSGTSQATAVTSGLAALLLQLNPDLSPDDVKCRIMSGASPALDADGQLAYSVFQQGAGFVDGISAFSSTATGCANVGIDIENDLYGDIHYGGRANQDEDGNYYIMDLEDSYVWDGVYTWSEGYIWGEGYVWGEGYIWGEAYIWGEGYIWGEVYAWGEAYIWGEGYVWGE